MRVGLGRVCIVFCVDWCPVGLGPAPVKVNMWFTTYMMETLGADTLMNVIIYHYPAVHTLPCVSRRLAELVKVRRELILPQMVLRPHLVVGRRPISPYKYVLKCVRFPCGARHGGMSLEFALPERGLSPQTIEVEYAGGRPVGRWTLTDAMGYKTIGYFNGLVPRCVNFTSRGCAVTLTTPVYTVTEAMPRDLVNMYHRAAEYDPDAFTSTDCRLHTHLPADIYAIIYQ